MSLGQLTARLGDLLMREIRIRHACLPGWARGPAAALAAATGAALLCGAYLNPRALVPAAGLGTVLIVGLAWPWLALRGLEGRLTFGRERAREGEPVPFRLEVRNRLPWGAWGLAVRGAVLGREGDGVPDLAHAGGRRTTVVEWSLVPAVRGVYPRSDLRLSTSFPFGLRECSRRLSCERPLVVWPRTFPVGPVPEASAGREGDGISLRPRSGTWGDPIGVRPYRRGDSLRRVHWPQTARQGRLIVCELQQAAVAGVQIVLDLAAGAHRGEAPGGSLEWAVRVAASFAEGWLAQGARVELVLGGEEDRPNPGSPVARRAALIDALARVEAGAPSLAEVLDGPACRSFAAGLRLVVATDLSGIEPRGSRAVVERWVVLDTAAFGGGPAGPGPDRRAWLWLDDPARVPEALAARRKEVALV